MSQFDHIEHGPPPSLDSGRAAFGARSVRADGRPGCGVRIMLKGFEILPAPDGSAVAFVDVEMASAVQATQALRQALADARKGRVR